MRRKAFKLSMSSMKNRYGKKVRARAQHVRYDDKGVVRANGAASRCRAIQEVRESKTSNEKGQVEA